MPSSIILPSPRSAATYWREMLETATCVFFQDTSGGVREFHYVNNARGGGKACDVKFYAKQGLHWQSYPESKGLVDAVPIFPLIQSTSLFD